MYLADQELARQLYELGIHSKTQILMKEQFESKKSKLEETKKNQNKDKIRSITSDKVQNKSVYENDPFLKALATREEHVLNGRLMVIIFIRIEIPKSKDSSVEISGYIDYAARLKNEDFTGYFEKTKPLQPKPSD